MDAAQQQVVLRAVAISALNLPQFSQADRHQAFQIVEDLKKYDGRMTVVLEWLHAPRHTFEHHDTTVATKLLALEICDTFLQQRKGSQNYAALNDADRLAFRDAIIKAARQACSGDEGRVLARKLAAVLEGIVIRDFPQKWPTFVSDVLKPFSQGGLWYDEPGATAGSNLGVQICLECLKLLAEDCTDGDFNLKIPTARRTHVVTGLNEVSGQFLPLIFQALEHFALLDEATQSKHTMHGFLLAQNRTLRSMTEEEAVAYRSTDKQEGKLARLLADSLLTLEQFCTFMPANWITGGSPDFIPALLHLMRENREEINVVATRCLTIYVSRGKLDFKQWMDLLSRLPVAINEANAMFAARKEHRVMERRVKGEDESEDGLAVQFTFHRELSKLLAALLSSYIPHISTNKVITSKNGNRFEQFSRYMKIVVEMLLHPSGLICLEQIHAWTLLLRDDQISKYRLLEPFLADVVSRMMSQYIRLRWDDVENETHPHTGVIETSFDDEEGYDEFMASFRSRSTVMFKLCGNVEPAIVTQVAAAYLNDLFSKFADGQPGNYLESNGQVGEMNDAVMAFEGAIQPLDNIISGIPSWALSTSTTERLGPMKDEIRRTTRSALSEITKAIVTWNPKHLWLKFRRASLLESVRLVWKQDPTLLLEAVDSLLRNLGLGEEWSQGSAELSPETKGLKKRSGVALVSIAKVVPNHLVPWLTQLTETTRTLLASDGLVPSTQMHLFEFLSCVAAAVEDPQARASFIGGVLLPSIDSMESEETRKAFSSVSALLEFLGVSYGASNPNRLTDPTTVQAITANYSKIFSAFNQILSVGRRCNEAARRKPVLSKSISADSQWTNSIVPDEGPISIQDLALNDPFVPLWPRILPSILQAYQIIMSIWKPENKAALLRNQFQKYIYAVADDEVFLSVKERTSAVVSGTNRKEANLVPKWSGWFTELHNCCYQLIGLLIAQRAIFAPELAPLFPRLVEIVTDSACMQAMDHRHMNQFIKHILTYGMICCPCTLYHSHLQPLANPVFEHLRDRLAKTWQPVITGGSMTTEALSSSRAAQAADLVAKGGESWLSWYYAHCGLFVGDLDAAESERTVEKVRVDLTRAYGDALQLALALKGDWALVLANVAKEEQAARLNDPSKLTTGPKGSVSKSEPGEVLNANGTVKEPGQAIEDARKMNRINGLCHFLLLESEQIAGNIMLTIEGCLGYPDTYTCRRVTKLCHRIFESVANSTVYAQLIGQRIFTQAVKNVVSEPKWMVGVEWAMINVVRDIYCRLVLGQALLIGGQGAGMQCPMLGQGNQITYEQAKTVNDPLKGGGILTTPSDYPRQVLLFLPGITPQMVQEFETNMKNKRSAKDQKEFIRELLRLGADNLRDMSPSSVNGSAAAGIFDRALEEESLLHSKSKSKGNKEERLVLHSKVMKHQQQMNEQPLDVSGFFN